MLIASNIIHLHFPRVLFHRVLYLWALRAPFSKGPPWGYFPSGTVVDHPPASQHYLFFWHVLNHTYIQNTSLVLQTFFPSMSKIVFFGGGVGGWEHVDQDEWAWLALSTPPSVQGLKWRRLKRMRKLRRGREQERRALFLFSPLFVFLCYSDVQSPLHASSIMPRWENDDESPGCKEAKYIKSG